MTLDKDRLRLRIYLALLGAVILLGTFGFMGLEGRSLEDAFYFTIVTIATVGYGDIAPATPLGKALAIVLIITGVGTFLGVFANGTEVVLNRREQAKRIQKLHMVIGLFFSEAGNRLLALCAAADPAASGDGHGLRFDDSWTEADFVQAGRRCGARQPELQIDNIDLANLRDHLNAKGDLLVRLLESPYMLEHEHFTDLVIATLHLKEELLHRADFSTLPASDLQHLTGDLRRVYALLLVQWLAYLAHLRDHYPFLFSLARRTNPFDPQASPIVG